MDSRGSRLRNDTSGSVSGLFKETDRKLLSSPNDRLSNSHWSTPSETHSPAALYRSPIISTPSRRTAGPLLASTHFNSNVSTYMDSKSPGLAERLVQYNDHTQGYRATHQARYGSPGVFPVVHLFKNSTPTRSATPSKVTVHIGLQDSSAYNMEYGNTLEDLNQHHSNGGLRYDRSDANVSSHSVLDALKEISRKRIQSEDQCLQAQDNCKRQRRECYTDTVMEFPSTTNIATSSPELTDVPCVMDAINASLSSSRSCLVKPRASIKRKPKHTPIEKKKLHHAETQTDIPLESSSKKSSNNVTSSDLATVVTSNLDVESGEDKGENHTESSQVDDANLFNETQLEAFKRNKLAILLSALSGEESTLPYKSDKPTENIGVLLKVPSIISPQNKPKHNKHVTFAIPEKENIEDASNNTKPSDDNNGVTSTVKDKNECNEILPPKVIAEKSDHFNSNAQNLSNSTPISTSFENSLFPKTSTIPLQFPTVDMNFKKQETMGLVNKSTEQGTVIAVSYSSQTATNATSPKLGGFKFDFKNNEPVHSKPQSITDFKLPPSLASFNTNNAAAEKSLISTNMSPVPMSSSPIATNMNFNYGNSLKQTSDNNSGNFSFDRSNINTSTFNQKLPSLPSYNVNTNNLGASPNFSLSSPQFGANTTVTSAFGTNTLLSTSSEAAVKTPSMGISPPTFNTAPISNFVTPQTHATQPFSVNTSYAPGFGFNAPTTNLPTASTNMFNFASNTSTGFSVPAAKPPPYSNPGFKQTSTTFSTPPLNKASDSLVTATNNSNLTNPFSSPIFGNSGNTVQFGQGSTSSTFASSNRNTLLGDSVSKPTAFNTTISNETNIFGVRDNRASVGNFNAFGSNSVQKSTMFDSTVGAMPPQPGTFTFGASNATSLSNPTAPGIFSFGGPNNSVKTDKVDLTIGSKISAPLTTGSNSVFGTVAPSVFGAATNPFSPSLNASFNPTTLGNPATPKFDSTGRIFSIGSGTSYPKSRTQLKARRRT